MVGWGGGIRYESIKTACKEWVSGRVIILYHWLPFVVFLNIFMLQKITDAEKTVRYRRALRPLNESRSPSPLPEIRIAASIVHHGKVILPRFFTLVAICFWFRSIKLCLQNVYATPNKGVLDGYTFDGSSIILLTPNHLTTPRTCPKKMGVMWVHKQFLRRLPWINLRCRAHLRQMVSHRPLKRRPLLHDSPSETRLAKQLARARIREIQSPRCVERSISFIALIKKIGRRVLRVRLVTLPCIYVISGMNTVFASSWTASKP